MSAADIANEFARLLVAKIDAVNHLQRVLRKKNRRLIAQHEALKQQRDRIRGLLIAFDEVQRADDIDRACAVAQAVLLYDERKEWR
jgi:hypothetical protein